MIKKNIVTLDINYNQEIVSLTRPYLKSYADKIGADLTIISERKYPNYPINIEKFQVYEISKDYDWTIFVDSDALIHPNCPDLTEFYSKDTVIFNDKDFYQFRFKSNDYSRRDGRNIGAATWMSVFSDWTRDLWKPYDNPIQYVDQINLMDFEKNYGYKSEHILDDYLVSLNIAKYGLKHKTIIKDIIPNFKVDKYSYFVNHTLCKSEKDKLINIKKWIQQFNTNYNTNYVQCDDLFIDMGALNSIMDKLPGGK